MSLADHSPSVKLGGTRGNAQNAQRLRRSTAGERAAEERAAACPFSPPLPLSGSSAARPLARDALGDRQGVPHPRGGQEGHDHFFEWLKDANIGLHEGRTKWRAIAWGVEKREKDSIHGAASCRRGSRGDRGDPLAQIRMPCSHDDSAQAVRMRTRRTDVRFLLGAVVHLQPWVWACFSPPRARSPTATSRTPFLRVDARVVRAARLARPRARARGYPATLRTFFMGTTTCSTRCGRARRSRSQPYLDLLA